MTKNKFVRPQRPLQEIVTSPMEAAFAYLKRGWSVIPVRARDKRPIVRWKVYEHRLPTTAEIRDWWSRYPHANVGIITGRVSGLVVVDIDAKDVPDVSEERANWPDTPMVVRTGGGGLHLFYRYPDVAEIIGNSPIKHGVHIRAEGGMVVAPPSLHESGRRYKWKRSRNSPLPDYEPPESRPAPPETKGGQDGWLSATLRGVSHGDRNAAAARLAGYYFSKRMPQDVVTQTMLAWNMKNDPPLSNNEIRTTVNSVFRTAYSRDNNKSNGNGAGNTAELEQSGFRLMGLNSYMTEFGDKPINWIIQDWLPEQTIGMVVAPPGSYKTWFISDLAISIASGTPFLGSIPVGVQGPVIMIQQEDWHGQMAERAANIIHSRFDLIDRSQDKDPEKFTVRIAPDFPLYFHPDRRLKFSDEQVVAEMEEQIAAIKPVLVIIDPLYSAGELDDYMAKTVSYMFALKKMRDKYGCSFLIAHHTGKGKGTETGREGAWGSQFLNAFLETGWQVRRKSDRTEQVLIRRHFKVAKNMEESLITFDISTEPPYTYKVILSNLSEKEMKRLEENDGPDIMAAFADGGAFTATEVADKIGIHRTSAMRRLVKLVEAKVLVRSIDPNKYARADDYTS